MFARCAFELVSNLVRVINVGQIAVPPSNHLVAQLRRQENIFLSFATEEDLHNQSQNGAPY